MPTTLTGLLLLVPLVLPGIAYVTLRERGIPERERSVFRETTTVIVAGVVANIVAFWVVVLVGAIWRKHAPNLDALIRDISGYIEANTFRVAVWSTALVIVATLLACAGAWLAGRVSPHPSTVSSWWLLFKAWPKGMVAEHKRKIIVRTACFLDDGSLVEGTASNFNDHADETGDRDIILVEPLERITATGEHQKLDSHAAVLSARNIKTMLLYYRSEPEPGAAPEPESGAEDGGATGT